MINIQPTKNLSDYPAPYRDYLECAATSYKDWDDIPSDQFSQDLKDSLIETKLDAMRIDDELEEHIADLVDDDIQEIHQQFISDNDLSFEE